MSDISAQIFDVPNPPPLPLLPIISLFFKDNMSVLLSAQKGKRDVHTWPWGVVVLRKGSSRSLALSFPQKKKVD